MHAIGGACPQIASLRGPDRSGRALNRHTCLYAGLIAPDKRFDTFSNHVERRFRLGD